MILIKHAELPGHINTSLNVLQDQINAIPLHAGRVEHARLRFERENRPGNGTFELIRYTLDSMCAGARRCMYCEDSAASEIEHFRPKSFYPELTFVWLNYLYSCSVCNRIKRDHFRILCGSSEYVDLLHSRTGVALEPPPGVSVLIDPRTEDPAFYLGIDLLDTFWFLPRHSEASFENARARYTIERMKLNERDYLAQARREAYEGYRALLCEYVKDRGTSRAQHIAKALLRCGHPSVWAEMKVQSRSLPELVPLFAAAPEAAAW